jgi:uncharacterized damage-inducible protein DinB
MRHERDELIKRAIREFDLMDHLVSSLTSEDWDRLLIRPETKDPWTVKDALAHITHWKADVIRFIRGQHRPPEEHGSVENDVNHVIYKRWRSRSAEEILEWHRQVQEDLLAALREAAEEWFNGRERREKWPYDLDGHSAHHRIHDIERALATRSRTN